jgi:flagellar basal body-associated protein FliL
MNFFINSEHLEQYEKLSDLIVIIIIVSVIIFFLPIFCFLCVVCLYGIALLFDVLYNQIRQNSRQTYAPCYPNTGHSTQTQVNTTTDLEICGNQELSKRSQQSSDDIKQNKKKVVKKV